MFQAASKLPSDHWLALSFAWLHLQQEPPVDPDLHWTQPVGLGHALGRLLMAWVQTDQMERKEAKSFLLAHRVDDTGKCTKQKTLSRSVLFTCHREMRLATCRLVAIVPAWSYLSCIISIILPMIVLHSLANVCMMFFLNQFSLWLSSSIISTVSSNSRYLDNSSPTLLRLVLFQKPQKRISRNPARRQNKFLETRRLKPVRHCNHCMHPA